METVVSFMNDGQPVYGVWHAPEGTPNGRVVIFLHGWGGYRIGPHRMFVTAARAMAHEGCACLRFDFRGRGDSGGETGLASIRTMISDTLKAIEFSRSKSPGSLVSLLGICSGAKVAMGAPALAPGVDSLVLWSAPPLGSAARKSGETRKAVSSVRTYMRKLGRWSTWRKLLTFRVNTGLVRKAVLGGQMNDEEEERCDREILDAFGRFKGEALFVHGASDPETEPASKQFSELCGTRGVSAEFHRIERANHNYYSQESKSAVVKLSGEWLRKLKGSPGQGAQA